MWNFEFLQELLAGSREGIVEREDCASLLWANGILVAPARRLTDVDITDDDGVAFL
jgi:hypothetical protein